MSDYEEVGYPVDEKWECALDCRSGNYSIEIGHKISQDEFNLFVKSMSVRIFGGNDEQG